MIFLIGMSEFLDEKILAKAFGNLQKMIPGCELVEFLKDEVGKETLGKV